MCLNITLPSFDTISSISLTYSYSFPLKLSFPLSFLNFSTFTLLAFWYIFLGLDQLNMRLTYKVAVIWSDKCNFIPFIDLTSCTLSNYFLKETYKSHSCLPCFFSNHNMCVYRYLWAEHLQCSYLLMHKLHVFHYWHSHSPGIP